MPFPGTVWAANTWDVDAWAANTWADASAPSTPDESPASAAFLMLMRRRRKRRELHFMTALAVLLAGCSGHPWIERPAYGNV